MAALFSQEELALGATPGIVAAGHSETSAAGAAALAAGGNAFDAALAALCASCVAEPMLASLGGGGYLMAQPAGGQPVVYDFFAHTPRRQRPVGELDFFPITADFGPATQEFHVGLGAMAVPGVVAGLFAVQRDLGRLDMREIMAPAIDLARGGVEITPFQNYLARVLAPILQATPEAMTLVATDARPDAIAPAGARVRNPDLADAMEALSAAGPELFYRGEWARQLAGDCQARGGQLTAEDLAEYRVERRRPVRAAFRGAQLAFNPPPSPGGCLLAFALGVLEAAGREDLAWGTPEQVLSISEAMHAAGRVRREAAFASAEPGAMQGILAPERLREWSESLAAPLFPRGTTHFSAADAAGNLASLSVSNGEGCAYILPGTGIMLNNMLGEEDLNPGGFHRWPEDRRLASMMCPTVLERADGTRVALGTGGANRIRSAVLQVIYNLLGSGLPLARAVAAPRFHLEGEHLSVEPGFPEAAVAALTGRWPSHRLWEQQNMFFGGVHSVALRPDGSFGGAGDPRRSGTVAATP